MWVIVDDWRLLLPTKAPIVKSEHAGWPGLDVRRHSIGLYVNAALRVIRRTHIPQRITDTSVSTGLATNDPVQTEGEARKLGHVPVSCFTRLAKP
ncbi:hypothetical protein CONPUDRAFT_138217 [Coniophora puteana RWD-64-598 SS2]|uniref:Uncharacterized protein n=1 Tax=Coniophora puteana (strain RWD-64-598) TaxID=741705 RepID=A0A5M3MI81_CONPW|nr:uncharacterized protein CONPUDRAFT_138217 [Coniophora puteana RWD-64-598 SS2]EIW78948.1 hypothetical protein CONPUDRAFT_138217 [Coniophora puteana RWD-64-598 SS2]